MGVDRRFYCLRNNSVFKFKIDTRYINAGATNGSENNLRFVLPLFSTPELPVNFIIKVNDGRPDVTVNNSNFNANRILTFINAGIYEIELIGQGNIQFVNFSPDSRKIIYIEEIGRNFNVYQKAFEGCINLVFDVPNLKLNTLYSVFYNIKGFGPRAVLSKYDVSKVQVAILTLGEISEPLTSVFQGFFISLTDASQYLKNTNLSLIHNIEIIAPNLTNANEMLYGSDFQGNISLKSESLTNINGFMSWVLNPVSLGKVDIRRVTTATNFITYTMSTNNVDDTLLGWQNNFDWSVIPSVPNKVTFDFYNSKYSNNLDVIAAKTFLESKGIVFTRLTIA